MKRSLICIICPRGCALEAELNDGKVSVSGNGCPRGAKYAADECIKPMRTVTSTVRVGNRENTMLSVKTSAPIPKNKIFEAMELIRRNEALAPINIGDTVIENVFGSDIVATKNIE